MPSRSSLSLSQTWLLRVVVVGAVALVANALFLVLFRLPELTGHFALPPDTLPVFYQSMVLSHTLLGLLIAPLAIVFALWHLPRLWKRRHSKALWTGVALLVCTVGLLLSGFFILSEANSLANRPWFWGHVGLAALLPAVYIVHRVTSSAPPTPGLVPKTLVGIAGAGLVALVVHLATVPTADETPEGGTSMATVMPMHSMLDRSADPFVPFTAPADVPNDSRFFPAAATTATGNLMAARIVTREELPDPAALAAEVEKYGFVKDHQIGAETCVRCHPDVVAQWASSSHRFSSMNNPFYRKPFLDMQERPDVGRERSQWCSSCHDPAIMLTGEVLEDFDPDGANAQAGLTCMACHAIDEIHNQTGNGNYNIPDHKESPYLFDSATSGLRRQLGDLIIKAKPTVHKARMQKDFFSTSEYCAACHKVSLDEPLNQYRWLRGQNEYDAWHDSGVSRNAARTFYLPENARSCQDCHMPEEPAVLGDVAAKGGMVKSHRFVSANTALAALRGDHDHVQRAEKVMQDDIMRVDILAVRRMGDGDEEREVVFAPEKTHPLLHPGETVEIQVVVRNSGVGHTFPGGTNDSNQAWIKFEVKQPGEGTLFLSGDLDENRYLDPSAERYGALMLAHDGDVAALRNAQDFHTPVWAKVIGPGTADIVRYKFTVPETAVGAELVLEASLMWRKFNRRYTEYVFEGKDVPDFPITRMAGDQVALRVVSPGTEPASPEAGELSTIGPEDWMRFNDLGIGLLLDGDIRGAMRAFGKVIEVAPDRIDGYRNSARVTLTGSDVEGAYDWMEKAEEIEPGDARSSWVWGNLLQADGRYDEAVRAYRRTLVDFPKDRDTWRRLGRTYYLDGQFDEALTAFHEVLLIDPEDRVSHYHRALCYRGLGDDESATEAEKAFEKYKADEEAQELTRKYRLRDPHAQFLSQPIHVHELKPRAAE